MIKTDSLNRFSVVADFITELCGKSCEAVLYDVVHTDETVMIVNNNESQDMKHIEIIQQLIDEKAYDSQDYVVNYADNGGRLVSVLFIKEQGRLAGVLCVAKDATAATRLIADFEAFLNMNNLRIQDKKEELGEISSKNDIDMLLHNMVKSEIEKLCVHPMRLTLDEKVQLVHKLKKKGALMISGAITEIANQLMVSEPSIYRYLSRLD